MTSSAIFLALETVDQFRWVGIADGNEEAGLALARIRQEPVAGVIPPVPVEWISDMADREIADFPNFRPNLLCVSKKARHALDEYFSPNGEWLPLNGLEGDYSAFHILREVDCLDTESVAAEKRRAPEFSFHSARYVPSLRKTAVRPFHVFRVPQSIGKFFVSDEFVQRYAQRALTGLDFLPVPFS